MFCPMCEEEREVRPVTSVKVKVRGEEFDVPVELYECTVCGERFDTPDNSQDELKEAYKLYREKHGYMQPEEIRALREKYGLNQTELANLLGWSVATLSRYENGALQDSTHDRVLKSLRDPSFLLNLLEENPDVLDQERRKELRQRLKEIIKKEEYARQIDKLVKSGNSIKIIEVIKYIANFCKLNKTKLNKILFYCDFTHFKEYGVSITELQYIHLPYGPCPEAYEAILSILDEANIIQRDYEVLGVSQENEDLIVEEKIKALSAVNMEVFSETELKVLQKVVSKLGPMTARELSEISHREAGYKETSNKEVIPYDYASKLKVSF